MKPIGIYIHVPFCEKKCPYCNFYSIAPTKELIASYKNRIIDELYLLGKKLNRTANTLYFGGGTPSILAAETIGEIISAAKSAFKLKSSEVTLEVNPTSASKINFDKLLSYGVNRLSIGLQSANENELQLLGRQHTVQMARNTVITAQKAGLNNISLDLMLAIPEQTLESLFYSIEFCSELNVQHISAYLLKVENGTPYFLNKNHLNFCDDNSQSQFYLAACKKLEELGFLQYEISNFSKPGYKSQHNLKYWDALEYLGLGPSAHSFINKKRFYCKNSLTDFINASPTIDDGFGGYEEEYSLLRLRLTDGLNNELFFNRFKKNIPKRYFENAKLYEKPGLVTLTDSSIKLTKPGFLVSNELISRIIL
ncbi:MAG: Heme chaperone HemW [Eubacteriales bacterium SKADARSKE-1]|nr:Heme chaperone HemW [Eubacteriales bacterium SKADARSKE-1]